MQLMGRLTILLWLACCASAYAVVYSNFLTRQQFMQYQDLLKQQRHEQVERGRLLLEKSSLSSYSRLEHIAKKQLNMEKPDIKKIRIVIGD